MRISGNFSRGYSNSFLIGMLKVLLIIVAIVVIVTVIDFIPILLRHPEEHVESPERVKSKRIKLFEYEESAISEGFDLGLAVKILAHPKLNKYFSGSPQGSIAEFRITYSCGKFKFEWSDDKVKVFLEDKLVREFEFTGEKDEVVHVSFNVTGYPVEMTLCVCEMLMNVDVPKYLREEVLMLLNQSPFVKWLEREGFNYTVESISYYNLSRIIVNCSVSRAIVKLKIDESEVHHSIYLKRPYLITLNTSLPRELLITQLELKRYNVVFLFCGRKFHYDFVHTVSEKLAPTQTPPREINVTEELLMSIVEMLKENEVLSRLLATTDCEVKVEDIKWDKSSPNQLSLVKVLIKSEEFKEYSIIVYINPRSKSPNRFYIAVRREG